MVVRGCMDTRYRAVIAQRESFSGVTVHQVNAHYDRDCILAQTKVQVLSKIPQNNWLNESLSTSVNFIREYYINWLQEAFMRLTLNNWHSSYLRFRIARRGFLVYCPNQRFVYNAYCIETKIFKELLQLSLSSWMMLLLVSMKNSRLGSGRSLKKEVWLR